MQSLVSNIGRDWVDRWMLCNNRNHFDYKCQMLWHYYFSWWLDVSRIRRYCYTCKEICVGVRKWTSEKTLYCTQYRCANVIFGFTRLYWVVGWTSGLIDWSVTSSNNASHARERRLVLLLHPYYTLSSTYIKRKLPKMAALTVHNDIGATQKKTATDSNDINRWQKNTTESRSISTTSIIHRLWAYHMFYS